MKRLGVYMKPFWREMVLAPAFKLLEAIFELLVPLLVSVLIDRVLLGQEKQLFAPYVSYLLATAFLGALVAVCAQYFSARAASGIGHSLRLAVTQKALSMDRLSQLGGGQDRLTTLLLSDVDQVQTGINLTLRLLLRSPFIVFGSIFMAFTIHLQAGWLFTGLVLVLGLVLFFFTSRTLPGYQKIQSLMEGLQTKVQSYLSGVRLIRSFDRSQAVRGDFEKSNLLLQGQATRMGIVSSYLSPVTFALVNITLLLLLLLGRQLVSLGQLTTGQVVALSNYLSQILVELLKLASLMIQMTRALACSQRIGRFLDEDSKALEGAGLQDQDGLDFAWESANFAYPNQTKNLFEDFSFRLSPGSYLGIIGPTGSGKSTLLDLLAGHLPANQGQILIQGQPIQEIHPHALAKAIGFVAQKPQFFTGTIRDNLVFGRSGLTDEDLIASLKWVEAWDWVQSLDLGLDTTVSQGGASLSGGQKQRLAIARALLGQAQCLMLDDSLSALDNVTEYRIRQRLSQDLETTSSIVVTQRIATIERADQILVLDKGKLVGLGTHQELLASNSFYRSLAQTQGYALE